MIYDLPTTITVDGKEYPIRDKGDYRVILDIIECLNDPEYADSEKAEIALSMFLDGSIKDSVFTGEMPENLQEAINQMLIFINCGETLEEENVEPPFMDWNRDLWLISPEVNQILGYETREKGKYTHWWSYKGAFMNIKDGMFCTYVTIRKKIYKGEKLDNFEREIYNDNYKRINISDKW